MCDIKYNEHYEVEYEPLDEIEAKSYKSDPEWELMALNIDLTGAMYELRYASINEPLRKRDFEQYVDRIRKAEKEIAEISRKLSTFAIGLGRKR